MRMLKEVDGPWKRGVRMCSHKYLSGLHFKWRDIHLKRKWNEDIFSCKIKMKDPILFKQDEIICYDWCKMYHLKLDLR